MGKTDFQASLTTMEKVGFGAVSPWLVLLSSSGQKSFIFQEKVRLLLGLKLSENRVEKEMKLPCKNTALTLPASLLLHKL